MIPLNLPKGEFKIKNSQNKSYIFDKIRKKYIVLTPEEWVRQNFIEFLVHHKKYPASLIAIEQELFFFQIKKRADIVLYNNLVKPCIIVECKAPSIIITQDTFDQIARYNLSVRAKYLIVTNGLKHYFCKMDYKNKTYIFLKDIPSYLSL